MIAVTIGITMKMDGTIVLIAMSIATDRIRLVGRRERVSQRRKLPDGK
jgi:hypothetical protein